MIQEDLNDSYRKTYKMRSVGEDGLNIIVSIPRQVIEREARKHNLTVDKFLTQFRATALYNGFEGIHYIFERTKQGDDTCPKATG